LSNSFLFFFDMAEAVKIAPHIAAAFTTKGVAP